MTGLPMVCANQASIAVPSSGDVNAASTASQDSISAKSPSTISASLPTVRPLKSRRIGSTASHPDLVDKSSRAAAVLLGKRRAGEIDLHAPRVRPVSDASTSNEFVALGHAGSEHYAGLETFPNPGVSQVEMTSDELVAVCPITGQPDLYVAVVEYSPDALCLESKSLKLYLNGYLARPLL